MSTDPTEGEVVTFSNCSVDGDNYEWDLGDGTTSTEAAPTHTYATAGTYNVEMIALSKNGKKRSTTNQNVVVSTASGMATFWSTTAPNAIAVVILDATGNPVQSITQGHAGGVTSCSTAGCATFELETGSYSWQATETGGGGGATSGTVTITANGCAITEVSI